MLLCYWATSLVLQMACGVENVVTASAAGDLLPSPGDAHEKFNAQRAQM